MSKYLRSAVLAGALLLASQPAVAEPLTLDQAIARALDGAPVIDASASAVEAARAGRMQADVQPNPFVTLEGENFTGTGNYDVTQQAEITATYSQPFERGGKRAARIGFAERDIGVAEAAARVARLDLIAAVERAFIDALIAREVVRTAEYRLSMEQEIEREAVRRVRGYKDPLFVETRAAARVAQAEIDLDQAVTRERTTLAVLASFWAGSADNLEIEGEFLAEVKAEPVLASSYDDLAAAEVARADAAIGVEQSKAVQDYTFSGGARYLRQTEDVALVIGVTIPLGRFDRNTGNIARAQAERLRAQQLAEAARLERLRRLASLRADALAARDRIEAIMTQVWPRTTKTLEQVREGYNRGGFAFRDVQDAADAMVEVQTQWLTSVTQYRDLQTEIDRLTGRFDAAVTGGINP